MQGELDQSLSAVGQDQDEDLSEMRRLASPPPVALDFPSTSDCRDPWSVLPLHAGPTATPVEGRISHRLDVTCRGVSEVPSERRRRSQLS